MSFGVYVFRTLASAFIIFGDWRNTVSIGWKAFYPSIYVAPTTENSSNYLFYFCATHMAKLMIKDFFNTYAQHLIRKSFYVSFFVLIIMVFLDFSVTLVMELENLSDRNSFFAVLTMAALEQPHKGLQYLESSMLIGTLIALTLFNQQGNLVFLRSIGFSPLKIVLIAGMGPALLSSSILLMDEFIFTEMSQNADIQLVSLQAKSTQRLSWQLKDNTLIGLQKLNNQNAKAIQVLEFDEQGSLIEIRKFSKGSLGNDQLTITSTNSSENSLEDFPYSSGLSLSSLKINTLSLRSLFQLLKNYQTPNFSYDSRLIMSSIYAKIFLPLSIIAVIFLAGSLMFGMTRSGGVGRQIIIGISFGLIYDLVKDLSIASFLTYQWPILWAHVLPIALLISFGLLSYRRI